jgi:hypothetical protein
VGRDRWSAAALALVAIAYLFAARRYPLDTLATPGPGVMPLAAGLAVLAAAIWLFVMTGRVGATRSSTRPPAAQAGLADPATTGGLPEARVAPTRPIPRLDAVSRAPLLLAGALVLYAALLPRVGFSVSSFALVVIAARLMGLPGWWRPVVLALGLIAASHVVFVRWLGVALP